MARIKASQVVPLSHTWAMRSDNFTFTGYEEFPVWGEIYKKQKYLNQPLSEEEKNVYEGSDIENQAISICLVRIGESFFPPIFHIPYDHAMRRFHSRMLNYEDSRIITSQETKPLMGNFSKYNPLIKCPELFRIFAELNPNDENAIMEFIKQYGPLSFTGKAEEERTMVVQFTDYFRFVIPGDNVTDDTPGYHHLTVFEGQNSLKTVWFEPLQWFKNELTKFKKLYNDYLKLKKLELTTKQEQREGYLYDWQKWENEEKPKLILFRKAVKGAINNGLAGAALTINEDDDEEFTPGFKFNTLYHALYIQLYNAAVGDKLGVCATPGCNKVFWKTRSDQLHCSRQCGSRARASKCYNKKKTLRAESD